MLPRLVLVIGGAASGKSLWAEGLLEKHAASRVYMATGQAWDAEMEAKIARHRARRGAGWHTVEPGADLGAALAEVAGETPVLLDCATMWLAGRMGDSAPPIAPDQAHDQAHDQAPDHLSDHGAALLADLARCPAPVVVVTNELGLSIVPENALARAFRQAQGELNQTLAARADLVVTVMAGLPLALKGQIPA